MNGAMFVDRGDSFVAVPRAILPSRPPTLQPRRLGAGQGWPICGPPWSASKQPLTRVAAADTRGPGFGWWIAICPRLVGRGLPMAFSF